MEFRYNDGGRAAAGFKGSAGDCVVRAIAIAAEMPYREVYDLVNEVSKGEKASKRKRGKSSARGGVHKDTTRKILDRLGWKWTPTMKIGQGCKVHLKDGELPAGRLIVSVSRHLTTVIDGAIHDTFDPRHGETFTYVDGVYTVIGGERCVYGYWQKENQS